MLTIVIHNQDVSSILKPTINVGSVKMAGFYMMDCVKSNVLPRLSDLVKKNVPSVLLDATPVLK
jgi:hypothetical protein